MMNITANTLFVASRSHRNDASDRKSNAISRKMRILHAATPLLLLVVSAHVILLQPAECNALSSFHGGRLVTASPSTSRAFTTITMRKQKASDKRTRRLQRGEMDMQQLVQQNLQATTSTLTSSPMAQQPWDAKKSRSLLSKPPHQLTGGRGRSRKRSTVYNSLSSYHNRFLQLLTMEYQSEEREVISRIKASVDDPMRLETKQGQAIYDMFPERRGNLFSDEVYRLVKAHDATQLYFPNGSDGDSDSNDKEDHHHQQQQPQQQTPSPSSSHVSKSKTKKTNADQSHSLLPPNHKFSNNDVIMVTLQPSGSGDLFDPNNYPTSSNAITAEARVIGTGPTYVDIAMPGGIFEATFGPAPNDFNNGGNSNMRLRADRFFSDVPYRRMVAAVTQLSAIPERTANKQASQMGIQRSDGPTLNGKPAKATSAPHAHNPRHKGKVAMDSGKDANPFDNIRMDEVLRDLIISTFAFSDADGPLFHDKDVCDLQSLANKVSKPPMPTSAKLANQALAFMQQQATLMFPPLNGPQLTAVGAALTRKFTAITGPPGTGKTTVASAVGFGFTHQCRSISPHAKVLATAFSNVGADNMVGGFQKLGLNVVRIGKPSAVSEHLWGITLDAIIDQDPAVQKATEAAARATAQLSKLKRSSSKSNGNAKNNDAFLSERTARELATAAVKRSIQTRNIAAAKAFREADVIVSTSTGASDTRLLAACGLYTDIEDMAREDSRLNTNKNGSRGGRANPTAGNSGAGTTIQIPNANNLVASARTLAPDGLPPLSLPFVIVDEACQSVEPATLIPLTASNSCRSLVLLGDPCQLPATVKHDPESLLSVSLMERLTAAMPQPMVSSQPDTTEKDERYLHALPIKQARSLRRALEQQELRRPASASSQHHRLPTTSYKKSFPGSLLLSVQYRMHPSISAFSSAMFYDGLLSTPWQMGPTRPFSEHWKQKYPAPHDEANVRFINVGGRCHERRGSNEAEESTTYANRAEAERVLHLIRDALLETSQAAGTATEKMGKTSIGVITPYSGQVQLIQRMIQDDEIIQKHADNASIEVKSVDGYQGRERDIIIFSAVRSNHRNKVGFLSDWRRLNVALTRAKNGLIVVGDLETLSSGDKNWAAFAKWCDGMGCIFDGEGVRSKVHKL